MCKRCAEVVVIQHPELVREVMYGPISDYGIPGTRFEDLSQADWQSIWGSLNWKLDTRSCSGAIKGFLCNLVPYGEITRNPGPVDDWWDDSPVCATVLRSVDHHYRVEVIVRRGAYWAQIKDSIDRIGEIGNRIKVSESGYWGSRISMTRAFRTDGHWG